MADLIIARVIHVIAIVLWIGGVAMVTWVLLPNARAMRSAEERVAFFEDMERRFARQARVTTLLAGASGFYMVHALDVWSRFGSWAFWWMWAMVGVWLLFTVMLFVLEPLVLHRWFMRRARAAPAATFTLIYRMHRLLLTISLITIAGAVAGSHGWSF